MMARRWRAWRWRPRRDSRRRRGLAENAGEIGGGAGVDVVALRSLIDMGFAPDEARSALAAGGGNVAAAVDILSAADDDLR